MTIGKWLPELTHATPLRVAARSVLEARAAGVEYYLQRVARAGGRDSEDVHQLRVATRRLTAALSIFKSCLDRQPRQRLRRAARKLRRAAGGVRDCDVQQSLLSNLLVDAERQPARLVHYVRRALRAQRRTLQNRLKLAIQRWSRPFRDFVAATLASLDAEKPRSRAVAAKFMNTARATMLTRLTRLRTASRRDLRDMENLHQLRIAAKRLRYAMEVCASCLSREFQHELYAEVEQLQEVLGEINDLRNLSATMEQFDAEPLMPVARIVEGILETRKARFLRRWTRGTQDKYFDRFERSLKRIARRRGAMRDRESRSTLLPNQPMPATMRGYN